MCTMTIESKLALCFGNCRIKTKNEIWFPFGNHAIKIPQVMTLLIYGGSVARKEHINHVNYLVGW